MDGVDRTPRLGEARQGAVGVKPSRNAQQAAGLVEDDEVPVFGENRWQAVGRGIGPGVHGEDVAE